MKKSVLLLITGLLIWTLPASAFDDYTHYTTIGNIGVTVTNFGLIGNGVNEYQPSCEYPLGSTIEMMPRGGLWVGAKKDGVERVSTAIVDGAYAAGQEGFEFAAAIEDGVIERSTIETSPFYSLDAISQQDFVCTFYDTFLVIPGTAEEIPAHTPLGIRVDLETYAWSFSYADAYVILNYQVTNISDDVLEDVYIGFWQDTAICNTTFNDAFGDGYFNWYDDRNGYLAEEEMCYEYDDDSTRPNQGIGDLGNAEVYFGFRFLGSSIPEVHAIYNVWRWNTASSQEYPQYSMPTSESQRYTKMMEQLPNEEDWVTPIPDSWIMLLSAGPFTTIQPGETVSAVFAIVGAQWATPETEDTEDRRENLVINSNWAKKVYNGEDTNGNGVLDEGEDLDLDGQIDRFFGPEPPPSPTLTAIPGDGQVTLYWDRAPEEAIDRISREKDFEGYRIYRVQDPQGLIGRANDVTGAVEGYTLVAQFDLVNNFGYDTGFDLIREPGIVEGDSVHYKFVDNGVLSGWPYYYAVTTFDRGDPETNLQPLASSVNLNKTLVYPGKTGHEIEDDSIDEVGVYPNPYRVNAEWDGGKERERLLWFTNLPPKCTIRVYTLAGDLVDTIHHDAMTYTGSDIQLLDDVSNGQGRFAGGQHGWDVISSEDQAIATGMYLYVVEDDDGNIKRGKFLVVK